MPNYRRNLVPGGTYFFTIVTYQRKPIFLDFKTIDLFWSVFNEVQRRYPFENEVYCLMPDHFHCIWTLPEGDADYPLRIKEIKRRFSRQYKKRFPAVQEVISDTMKQRRELGVWQRRYWEHTIQSQDEFNRCMDYIHWNPVEHGLVKEPFEWKHSSFHKYVQNGVYDRDWVLKGVSDKQRRYYGDG